MLSTELPGLSSADSEDPVAGPEHPGEVEAARQAAPVDLAVETAAIAAMGDWEWVGLEGDPAIAEVEWMAAERSGRVVVCPLLVHHAATVGWHSVRAYSGVVLMYAAGYAGLIVHYLPVAEHVVEPAEPVVPAAAVPAG